MMDVVTVGLALAIWASGNAAHKGRRHDRFRHRLVELPSLRIRGRPDIDAG